MKDQNETFSMANMVPQTAKSNQVAIRLIEAKIHDIAENGTGVHIVTGVIVGDNPSTIGNGVVVPDKTFKAVRFDDNSSCVWVFPNTKQLSPNELYSLESFNLKYGILPFPGIIEDQNISKLCN
jgi:endonuclease G